MVSYPPYFIEAGKDPLVLVLSIIFLVFFTFFSIFIIENKCKNLYIKKILYIGLILQVGIILVDHFVKAFPTIILDPRAFERSGWYSYIFNINIGRGEYNYWIINPIYKMLKVRVAIIFSLLNMFFTVLINLNLYEVLKKLRIKFKLIKILMIINVLSPISLIMKAGIQREAIIILLISYSVKNFIDYFLYKDTLKIFKSFLFLAIASIFHSGVLFLASGYLIYLLGGKGTKKIYQYLILIIILGVFILFKEQLLEKVGGGDIDQIIRHNNQEFLKEAGSAYLTSISTTSLSQIFLFLPLFMFYFLYSPTPNMIRGVLDIATFILNSSIFICFTFLGTLDYFRIKNKLSFKEKRIIKSLFLSLVCTIAVFSIGTRNAGTAMRHRDKIIPFLTITFAIIENKKWGENCEKIFDKIR